MTESLETLKNALFKSHFNKQATFNDSLLESSIKNEYIILKFHANNLDFHGQIIKCILFAVI